MAVYEPFDYPAGALSGRSGSSEVGLTGTWSANDTLITAGSFSHGGLLTKGGRISNLAGGINRFAGARAVSSSALAGNGLLDDGATLWFSAIVGYDTGGNVTNSRLAIALANSQFNSGNYDYWIKDEGSQPGAGVGLVLGNINGNGRVVATRFRDLPAGDGIDGNVLGSWTGAGSIYTAGNQGLIVGKITWGATPDDLDRIELYQPGTNLVLPASPISVLETKVNQSAFDTLTMARGDKIVCDEIRFGATYHSILAGSAMMGADLSPPVPNPMVFHSPPAPSAAGSVSMVAATAYDPAGVEYCFTCITGSESGGTDSGWQDSPAYTDTGLTPGVPYSYSVKARDKSSARNETGTSASASVAGEVDIPNVTGLLLADAGFIVTASHLHVGNVTSAASLTTPAGHVISQSPAGAGTADSFSTVDLVVSLGALMTDVPDVLGYDQVSAEAAIVAANLVAGTVSTQHDAVVATGHVISQSPAGGVSGLQGSSVALVVSLGPEIIPDDYETWAGLYAPADLADPDADHDKDGLSNNDERIWGLDPANATSRDPIRALPDPGNHTFRYSRRSPEKVGRGYSVWTSMNLTSWLEDTAAVQTPGPADANDVEIVDVTLSVGSPEGGRLFVQVRATGP